MPKSDKVGRRSCSCGRRQTRKRQELHQLGLVEHRGSGKDGTGLAGASGVVTIGGGSREEKTGVSQVAAQARTRGNTACDVGCCCITRSTSARAPARGTFRMPEPEPSSGLKALLAGAM